ncbi:hypothetical protein ACFBZI_11720 [Moraxella sp. ZJ142]|uniref:hypothetical protein n=1 Tax=Moraxella marmotae TaxID=3344520 RepID=UPI0035D3E496
MCLVKQQQIEMAVELADKILPLPHLRHDTEKNVVRYGFVENGEKYEFDLNNFTTTINLLKTIVKTNPEVADVRVLLTYRVADNQRSTISVNGKTKTIKRELADFLYQQIMQAKTLEMLSYSLHKQDVDIAFRFI